MMKLSDLLIQSEGFGMLNHCFYKHYWNSGLLNRSILAQYAKQYYYVEKAFIECLEILLNKSKNEDNASFYEIINENLQEELGNSNGLPHLQLLSLFAREFNVSIEEINHVRLNPETKIMINNFKYLCEENLISGIGVMFAYEHQIPKIAESKIDTLRRFYGVSSEESLLFFKTHLIADVWHTKQWISLIDTFSEEEMKIFRNSFFFAMQNLNHFLDGMVIASKLEF